MVAVGRRHERELTRGELDGMTDDLAAFGFGQAEVAKARGELGALVAGDDGFDVLAVNATAVRLFLALRTQWRVTGLSTMSKALLVQTGLDYGVIQPTAQMEGLELEPDDFRRLRIMEAEAMVAFAEAAR